MAIREILENMQSECVNLIEKVLRNGYIQPPADYKWHGCYQILLSDQEKMAVMNDLTKAQDILAAVPSLVTGELDSLRQYISYWSRMLTEVPESYDEHKSTQIYYDLRNISFDEFLNFIFDHEVVDLHDKGEPWYYDEMWIDWNKEFVANLFIELFNRSDELLVRFSPEKLEQGFWAVVGPNLECNAYNLIHDDDVDVAVKEKLICSMYFVYEKLFANNPLDTSSNMWWDCLAYGYYEGGPRNPANDEEDRRIQNAMFSTLIKILSLKSEACQGAALHGLGHLRHPKTEGVIADFIKRNSQLTSEQIAYAKACITGDIM